MTKKVGNAVVRNRTRRRLKEAARLLLREHPVAGADLVLIGRDSTRKRDFVALQDDIRRALDKTGVDLERGWLATSVGPGRDRRRARLSMDDPAGDRRQLPLLAKLQRLRDRGPAAYMARCAAAALAARRILRCNPWHEGGCRSGAPLRSGNDGRPATWGIDGPEAALPGDRGFARDPAGLPVPGRAASAAAAAAASIAPATSATPADRRRRAARGRAAAPPAPTGASRRAGERAAGEDRRAARCAARSACWAPRSMTWSLTDYRETIAPEFAAVRLLEPLSDDTALLHAVRLDRAGRRSRRSCRTTTRSGPRSADTLSAGQPVTLSWDNGAGPDLPDRAVGR